MNIRYKHVNIKQHSQATYLGCVLDEARSGEPIALKVLNKINGKLKFFFIVKTDISQKSFAEYSAMLIQPYFDYVCPAR